MTLEEHINKAVGEFVDKFVAPTIPGTMGAIQIEHVRRWLGPTLTTVAEAGKEAERKRILEALEKEITEREEDFEASKKRCKTQSWTDCEACRENYNLLNGVKIVRPLLQSEPTAECCEKCEIYLDYKEPREGSAVYQCRDRNCPCHSSSPHAL